MQKQVALAELKTMPDPLYKYTQNILNGLATLSV